MITATRYRHATEEERRLGSGPMKARTIRYRRIEKSDLLERLHDAQHMDRDEEGYVEVRPEDIACAEAGRPVPEHLLKSLYGSELAGWFVDASPDAVADAEDLVKSEHEADAVYETVMVVSERYTARDERPWGTGPIVKSETQCFLPSVADLRDRLRKAEESGASFVRDTDMNLLDRGMVREVVLKSLYPEVPLEEIEDGDDLADALARPRPAAGHDGDEPLRKSASKTAVRPEAASVVKTAYKTHIQDLRSGGRMADVRRVAEELEDLVTRGNFEKRGIRR